MKEINIAIVGATGVVGESALSILSERNLAINKLYPLASERSAGRTVVYKNRNLDVIDLAKFDFGKVDIAIFSAGGDVSREYAPIAAGKGCIVIDNTSCFRYDDDIPLIVPEVNSKAIKDYKKRNIIANPNCSTIQMLVAINPLHEKYGIREVIISTYQAASGAGKKAISELIEQTSQLLNGKGTDNNVFSRQLAFNVIPHIDVWQDNGYSKEEMKMVWETKKILNDSNIVVNPTAVRVPSCYGHAESIHLRFKQDVSLEEVHECLDQAPGVTLLGDSDDFPTPFENGSGTDDVYVGRVRQAIGHNDGINMWVVADNVRKGAALNAVQIAEILIKDYL